MGESSLAGSRRATSDATSTLRVRFLSPSPSIVQLTMASSRSPNDATRAWLDEAEMVASDATGDDDGDALRGGSSPGGSSPGGDMVLPEPRDAQPSPRLWSPGENCPSPTASPS